ncbi:HAD-IIA family hydrolase [Natronospora cellulosivora (SeqCode)]
MQLNELNKKKCFLLDMDGTIYLSNDLIDGAKDFVNLLKSSDKDFYFFTNNSSKSSADYVNKLSRLGIEIEEKRIITSGEVTIDYILKKKNNPLVYLLGTPSLEKQFLDKGIRITKNKDDNIDFLVLAFDTSLDYKKLWDAHDLILRGVEYLATNPDYVCPLAGGKSMPDCGAMINLLKTSTGKEPLVIGKPNTLMVDYIIDKTGLERKEFVMMGDRLYTDIQTAINAQISSVLVLSGESTKKDVLTAKQDPDFLINSVKDLLEVLN